MLVLIDEFIVGKNTRLVGNYALLVGFVLVDLINFSEPLYRFLETLQTTLGLV